MKMNYIFKSLPVVALMCMTLLYSSCDTDENPVIYEEAVIVETTVETSDDLRAIADFNVYFTDLSGAQIDISNQVATNSSYAQSDTLMVKDLALPLELCAVMEISAKSDAQPGRYVCSYNLCNHVNVIDSDSGDVIAFNQDSKTSTWVVELSSPADFTARTVTARIALNSNNEGGIIIGR